MNSTQILILVALLVCPITMGTMMWMMNRNMKDHPGHDMAGQHKTSKVPPRDKEQS